MTTVSAARPVTWYHFHRFTERFNEGGFPGRTFSEAFVEEFNIDREDPDTQELLKERAAHLAHAMAQRYFVES